MAEAAISTVVNEVAGRLASAAFQVCGLLAGLEDDRSAVEEHLIQIQADLHAAEKKQPEDERVELRLKRLKSASLEAENVLDEAKTVAMIQKMHGEMGRKYMLRTFFTSRYNPLMVRFRIAHKLNNIRKTLDEINADRSNTTSKDEAGIGGKILNRETTSRMPMQQIIGRNEDKKIIVEKICSQDIGIRHDDKYVPVYTILGMGGIGKTTLAKLVYNDETVKKHFDLKRWVYVSDVFDVKRIIKDICGPEDKKLDEMSLEHLLGQLQNELKGKKYFIIMDDVWIENKDMNEWENLCTALRCGAEGSTVMVTTRKEDTAQLMAKIPALQHNVAVLSEEESWSLFEKLAFPGRGEPENVSSELKLVGKEIVKKCNGLPLAVKTLGSFMLTIEKEVNAWQRVKNDFMWQMQNNNILPVLRLSYHNLLPHWKRCFSYCCVFSKGEEMSKDLLIELWMANEFIPSQGDLSLYEHGEEILSCLVQRSFFQVEEDGYTGEIYKMHDLMHDLALDVMKHDCAVIGPGKESITPDEVLHLSLTCEDFEFSKQDLKKLRSVRSMLVFYRYRSNIRQISNHVYLRVLYLNKIESSTLPESICKLIHLRYLKIEDSDIEVLPESIIDLQNLQTLILEVGWRLRELPKGLRYMRNLQRLHIGYCPQIQHMPVGIKELTSLRRLSEFVVGKDDGARIVELGNLNRLGWDLKLSGLENVGRGDAESANLKDKTNLKSLSLEWGDYHEQEISDSEEVLEGLEPNSGLQELTIWNYVGRVNSLSWMVKLVNLTSIKLRDHKNCEQLPPLGKLRSLKRIKLEHMDFLKCFHDDDYVTSRDGNILFPNLQNLNIRGCGSLVSLPSNFPKLRSLKIHTCDKLLSLPHEIQNFKDLNQIFIKDCEILNKRCLREIGKDWPKISHIPYLSIELSRWRRIEDTDDDSVNYRDEDNDEIEDKDDNSVNYRDEDSDENEDKDDDSVNYRDED